MKWITFYLLLCYYFGVAQGDTCSVVYKGKQKNKIDSILASNCSNLFLGDANTFVFSSPNPNSSNSLQKIYFRLSKKNDTILNTPFKVIHKIQTKSINNSNTIHYIFGENNSGMNVSKIVQEKDSIYYSIEEYLEDSCQLIVDKMNFDENGLLTYIKCRKSNSLICNGYRIIREDATNIDVQLSGNSTFQKASYSDFESKLIIINDSLIFRYDSLNRRLLKRLKKENISPFFNSIAVFKEGGYYHYIVYNKGKDSLEIRKQRLDFASPFINSYAIIKESTKFSIIDINFKEVKIPQTVETSKPDTIYRVSDSSWFVIQESSEDRLYIFNPNLQSTIKYHFVRGAKSKVHLLFDDKSRAYFWIKEENNTDEILNYNSKLFITKQLKKEVTYVFQALQDKYFMYESVKSNQKESKFNYFKFENNNIIFSNTERQPFNVSLPIIKNFAIGENKIVDAEDFF